MPESFDATPRPATEPAGSRMPPRRDPPTAVGVATPPPPRPSRPTTPMPRTPWLVKALRRGVDSLFDLADSAADAVRAAVGMERASPAKVEVRTLPRDDA